MGHQFTWYHSTTLNPTQAISHWVWRTVQPGCMPFLKNSMIQWVSRSSSSVVIWSWKVIWTYWCMTSIKNLAMEKTISISMARVSKRKEYQYLLGEPIMRNTMGQELTGAKGGHQGSQAAMILEKNQYGEPVLLDPSKPSVKSAHNVRILQLNVLQSFVNQLHGPLICLAWGWMWKCTKRETRIKCLGKNPKTPNTH